MGPPRPARGVPRPRLVASLVAWAVVASLLLLHRTQRDVQKCMGSAREGLEQRDEAAAVAAARAAAAAAQAEGAAPVVEAALRDRYASLPADRIEAMIRAPVGLHGAVQKGGLPANFPFVVAHLTDTNPNVREEGIPATMGPAIFRWFAQAYTFNQSAGHSSWGLQSPVPACHFWADHKYKILYVRNFKTAGTSISITLGQKELPMYCTYQPDTCASKCKNKQVCLENISNLDRLRQLFKEYTVFSFVRNPWARALSSWHHVHKHGMKEPCFESFEKWAQLPSRYGAKCLAERDCCRRRFGWLLEHIEPQSTCLFDDQGRPSVDFFGRVENLDEDMQEFVKIVNSRLEPGVEPLRVGRMPRWQLAVQELRDKQDELWRYYASIYANSSSAMADIRSYFHRDFDLMQVPDRPGSVAVVGGIAAAGSAAAAAAAEGTAG
ncbi:Sulfotransferase family [Micractinium conductrix]|uniref:Sulfotransferase family n=1 Tax=Micractinium conductrix TaxID=554055 RepID=A0A2P6V7J1_9CHLO|nr:Sulfotransferase family [Micractinium conductrix]|eukprot:PSC70052.1 Sulfotransferase family [Micractinium conductrix]